VFTGQRACRQISGAPVVSFRSSIFRRSSTIARPRYFRPHETTFRGPAINDRIRARQVFLIDQNNEKVGVVDTIEALRRSHDAGLDLVEVAPDSAPPVCRILDFGKYKYELAKKEKAQKAKSKTVEMKEVRLGRSMKIDPHDVGIRIDQARRFLMEGHKVQIVQNFRGRELMHRDRGDLRMKEIIEKLADISKVEIAPRMAGRRMSVILTPDKPKIEAILRKQAKAAPRTAVTDNGEPGAKPAASAAAMPAEAKA
jgi:translation initiation factor IF-3